MFLSVSRKGLESDVGIITVLVLAMSKKWFGCFPSSCNRNVPCIQDIGLIYIALLNIKTKEAKPGNGAVDIAVVLVAQSFDGRLVGDFLEKEIAPLLMPIASQHFVHLDKDVPLISLTVYNKYIH